MYCICNLCTRNNVFHIPLIFFCSITLLMILSTLLRRMLVTLLCITCAIMCARSLIVKKPGLRRRLKKMGVDTRTTGLLIWVREFGENSVRGGGVISLLRDLLQLGVVEEKSKSLILQDLTLLSDVDGYLWMPFCIK